LVGLQESQIKFKSRFQGKAKAPAQKAAATKANPKAKTIAAATVDETQKLWESKESG
jgi:hypothetical protein